jgi:hypothetical protein
MTGLTHPLLTQDQVDAGKRAHKRGVYRHAGRLLARHGSASLEYLEAHLVAARLRLAQDYFDPPVVRFGGHEYRAFFHADTGELLYAMVPCSTCALCLDGAAS